MAWEYHIDVQPQVIGFHFLSLNAGFVAAAAIAQNYVRRDTRPLDRDDCMRRGMC